MDDQTAKERNNLSQDTRDHLDKKNIKEFRTKGASHKTIFKVNNVAVSTMNEHVIIS